MKIFNSEENSQSGENSQLLQKFYALGKTRNLEENFELRRNFLGQKKILNSGENSELMGKSSILRRILNSGENFLTQNKILNQEKILNSSKISQL